MNRLNFPSSSNDKIESKKDISKEFFQNNIQNSLLKDWKSRIDLRNSKFEKTTNLVKSELSHYFVLREGRNPDKDTKTRQKELMNSIEGMVNGLFASNTNTLNEKNELIQLVTSSILMNERASADDWEVMFLVKPELSDETSVRISWRYQTMNIKFYCNKQTTMMSLQENIANLSKKMANKFHSEVDISVVASEHWQQFA